MPVLRIKERPGVKLYALLLIGALCVPGTADARSKAQVNHFRASHPCPATGRARGPCPGYVVDHVKPLCAGGADHPSNMQWQTVKDAKIKDRAERAQCRRR
jgi:hypothetical protein